MLKNCGVCCYFSFRWDVSTEGGLRGDCKLHKYVVGESDDCDMWRGKEKIVRNMARCKKCLNVIESKHRWDFVSCQCGGISVDGGKEYLRRVGNMEDCEDLSVIEGGCDGNVG